MSNEIYNVHKEGLQQKNIHADIIATLGNDVPIYNTVKWWTAIFKHGRTSAKVDSL